MTPFPHTIGQEQQLEIAAETMKKNGFRHLPVLHGGELIGLLSSRDIDFLRSVAGVTMAELTVEEAMSQDVKTVDLDYSMVAVLSIMAERKVGSIVVTEGKRPVGIFTTTDAVQLLLDYEKTLGVA